MHINLNKLITETNKRFDNTKNDLIILELCDDNELKVSKGNTTYFCKY